ESAHVFRGAIVASSMRRKEEAIPVASRDSARCLGVAALAIASMLQIGSGENQYVPPSSNPESLYVHGNHVYFSADDGIHGRELWRADIDGNAELVKDITPGRNDSLFAQFCTFKDYLYFSAG